MSSSEGPNTSNTGNMSITEPRVCFPRNTLLPHTGVICVRLQERTKATVGGVFPSSLPGLGHSKIVWLYLECSVGSTTERANSVAVHIAKLKGQYL